MSTDFKRRSTSTHSKYRKWPKVIEPLQKFSRQSSPLSYYIQFIMELQKIISKGQKLQLNIPLTLSGAHDNCIRTIYKDDRQEIGSLVFTQNLLKSTFDTELEKDQVKRIESLNQRDSGFRSFLQQKQQSNTVNQTLPFCMIKQKSKPREGFLNTAQSFTQTSESFIFSKDQYKKVATIQATQLVQSFIYPNTSTCSIIRYFHFPKKETLSIAYKIDNNENFLKKRFLKTLWRIEHQQEHSFTFVKILYKEKAFARQVDNIVKAMETFKKCSVEKIVTDWVVDSFGRHVLVDVKELAFCPASSSVSLPLGKSLSNVLQVITCCVCQEKFQCAQMSKLITHKLIYEFFQHLKKRRVQLSFKPNYKYCSSTAKVCDLCYMLVVSEAKLIQLQKVMAKATNSVERVENQYSKMLEQVRLQEQSEYKEKNLRELYTWRLFFYIEDIKELLSLASPFNPETEYFLMLNLHNEITSFKLENLSQEREHLPIRGLKVSYLFSQTEKIDKFLNKSEILIRITQGNNWNDVVAEGSSTSLYEQNEKFSMRKYKQILLFNFKSKYCVLGLHIGIKLDGKYCTQKLTLNKVYDAYLANEKYINCLSMPPEWMQIIDPIYCVNKDRSKKFQYEMNMTQKQIKSLLPALGTNSAKRKLVL